MTTITEMAETIRTIDSISGAVFVDANEDQRQQIKDTIKELLNLGTVDVTFTKADGTIRDMNCTLNEHFGAKYIVKENKEGSSQRTKTPNDDVCVVWDTAAKGWRSFRWDRLVRINTKSV